MTMTFSLNDNLELAEMIFTPDYHSAASESYNESAKNDFHLFAEKLQIPEIAEKINRPRLTELLSKSAKQFGATLITGRAGTGKTALAADFARQYKKTAWFSIDSSDCEWSVFARYFVSCVLPETGETSLNLQNLSAPTQADISKFLVEIFTQISLNKNQNDTLIVLDGVHYVFDTAWFSDFFNLLLHSLLPNTHLLLLCRSKPPLPLWRLRSKQILNVVDEKLLALNQEETEMLYESYGLPNAEAQKAFQKSFGRISKLVDFAETFSDKSKSE